MKAPNTQTINQARAFLRDWPHLAAVAAIMQLAAMLALDWTQAEAIYQAIKGA
jgi:hypothetical protein